MGCGRTIWSRRGVVLALTGLTAACQDFPRDSGGALERIRRERRVCVGAVHHPPWVRLDDGEPGGLEADLVRRWSAQLGATIAWTPGALDPLSDALHRRALDLLIAGFDDKTPYAPKLALSQPYLTAQVDGRSTKRILAVQPGESGLLTHLDRFLLAQDEAALARQAGVAR